MRLGASGRSRCRSPKAFGAHVTGVCSTTKSDLLQSIGADRVIDYTSEDFTQSGERYDVILDTAGNRSLSHLRRALTPRGTLVIIGGEGGGRWLGMVTRMIRTLMLAQFVRPQKLRVLSSTERKEDLEFLRELIQSGKVAPVIDRMYTLHEAAEAIRYIETGHARGKVIIAVSAMGGA